MLRRPFLITLAALAMSSLAFALPAAAANPQVEFDTTAGKIRVELYPDAAPKTVANFLDYVKAKHYDGTQFHRVIAGFMIQGGGYTADFKQKPTKPPVPIESEQSSKAGLLNVPGTLAMARTCDPNSATAQFFINVNDNKSAQLPLGRRAGLRLHGLRQGRRRHGRRRQDRQGARPAPAARSRRTFPPRGSSSTRPTSSKRNRDTSMVILHTNHGDITLELDAASAPKTVANFLQYVRDGHYDNTMFHRVIDGFMIQGGGMAPGMKQKPTRAAGRQRSGQRPEEQALHGGDGAHVRSALGDRAVLHQRRRQRLPRPHGADGAGLGLLRVRQGGRRAGRRRQDQGRSPPPTAASTRTCRART